MTDSPPTRPSLLVRISDTEDQQAWAEFVEIYTPLIHRLARRSGLQDADAADLAQEVFRAVAGAIGRWDLDPARGSFGGWLSRIARNLMLNFLAAQRRHPRGSGDTDVGRLLEQAPAPDEEATALFEVEYRRQLFHWAVARVRHEFRESTWQAFWRTAVESQKPRHVAEALGLTVGTVYVYRNRVMSRIRRAIERYQGEPFPEKTAMWEFGGTRLRTLRTDVPYATRPVVCTDVNRATDSGNEPPLSHWDHVSSYWYIRGVTPHSLIRRW
jgi:RNA polymerase sigma factor (sigma-70 family)